MTVKALKKKNNMSGPFKMKGNPMQRNFGISPVRKDGAGYADTVASAKRKETRDDTMQDTVDSGSFDQAFASARKAGKKVFTYKGKSYNTKLAE
mgnify:CR=1 FL=1